MGFRLFQVVSGVQIVQGVQMVQMVQIVQGVQRFRHCVNEDLSSVDFRRGGIIGWINSVGRLLFGWMAFRSPCLGRIG